MIDTRPKRVIPLKAEPEPSCGPCTLCCKVMGIDDGEFKKPKDQWCPHARKKSGCGIYETRPTVCQSFKCLWLAGKFGDTRYRPDKIHGVITMTTDGKNFVIHEDPGYRGHATIALKPVIDRWIGLNDENYVIVVCGTNRTFFGKMAKFEQLRAAGNDEVAVIKNVTVLR